MKSYIRMVFVTTKLQIARNGEIKILVANLMIREKNEQYKSEVPGNKKYCEQELKKTLSLVVDINLREGIV